MKNRYKKILEEQVKTYRKDFHKLKKMEAEYERLETMAERAKDDYRKECLYERMDEYGETLCDFEFDMKSNVVLRDSLIQICNSLTGKVFSIGEAIAYASQEFGIVLSEDEVAYLKEEPYSTQVKSLMFDEAEVANMVNYLKSDEYLIKGY